MSTPAMSPNLWKVFYYRKAPTPDTGSKDGNAPALEEVVSGAFGSTGNKYDAELIEKYLQSQGWVIHASEVPLSSHLAILQCGSLNTDGGWHPPGHAEGSTKYLKQAVDTVKTLLMTDSGLLSAQKMVRDAREAVAVASRGLSVDVNDVQKSNEAKRVFEEAQTQEAKAVEALNEYGKGLLKDFRMP